MSEATRPTSIRLSVPTRELLDQLCLYQHQTQSDVIRQALIHEGMRDGLVELPTQDAAAAQGQRQRQVA